ncbi:MAG: HlyC/CorC family transporter [Flavisolibacter sp.]|nr:HlyC/CorC family transporter [Flavisolibacter sp.]MBD0378243.1 HlyC/CorC family transporter [Flavisolibacter sp.]
MLLDILLTLFLVFLNGFFVAAEFAIVKVRSSQIETSEHQSVKISGVAKKIVSHLDAYLAATQLGITLASLGLGWIGEGVVSSIILRLFDHFHLELSESVAHDIALPIAFMFITVMHIVFGELAPKSVAIRYPSKTTFAVALPLQIFYYIFRPFIWLLNGFANFFLKLIGIRPVHNIETHTEEELKVIIQESADSGAIQQIEQGIVERVFILGDRKVSELMTHRTDLVWLDINDDLITVKQKVKKEIHSVYPVCDGNIDNLVGVLSLRELFPLDLSYETFQLKDYVRKAVVLIENTPAYKVLERFKEEKFHYGIVVDEFGVIQGIVSMDDVTDALLGELSEYNQEEYKIVKRDENSWLADAKIPFFLFLEYFDIAEGDKTLKGFNTLAGFMLHNLEHIPSVGEKFRWKDFEFEVVDMDGRRVDKILIQRKS